MIKAMQALRLPNVWSNGISLYYDENSIILMGHIDYCRGPIVIYCKDIPLIVERDIEKVEWTTLNKWGGGLNSEQDFRYLNGINPVKVPPEGIKIWGQKTILMNKSVIPPSGVKQNEISEITILTFVKPSEEEI